MDFYAAMLRAYHARTFAVLNPDHSVILYDKDMTFRVMDLPVEIRLHVWRCVVMPEDTPHAILVKHVPSTS